jgi:hypothetical protein
MYFDPFAHRPTVALDGCLVTGLCLVIGLSTLPLWHVQRDVETSNNLNKNFYKVFQKRKKFKISQ